MLRWLQTEKFAITADKLPTRYLGIDIQRTEDGFLLPQAKLISLTSNVHWHAMLELIVFSKESTPTPTEVPKASGQRKCRIHPERCYNVQAEANRGCNLDQIARLP